MPINNKAELMLSKPMAARRMSMSGSKPAPSGRPPGRSANNNYSLPARPHVPAA